MLWDAHCLAPLHLSTSQERPVLFPPNWNPPLYTFATLPTSAFVHTSPSAENAFPPTFSLSREFLPFLQVPGQACGFDETLSALSPSPDL